MCYFVFVYYSKMIVSLLWKSWKIFDVFLIFEVHVRRYHIYTDILDAAIQCSQPRVCSTIFNTGQYCQTFCKHTFQIITCAGDSIFTLRTYKDWVLFDVSWSRPKVDVKKLFFPCCRQQIQLGKINTKYTLVYKNRDNS